MVGDPRARARERLESLSRAAVTRQTHNRFLALGLAAVGLVAFVGVRSALLFGLAGLGIAAVTRRMQAQRQAVAVRNAVVEVLRAVAGELRAGRPGGLAFRVAVEASPEPVHADLQPAAEAALGGDAGDLAAALELVAVAPSAAPADTLDGLVRLAACWRVAARSGAALAPAIDRVADALQAELELARALATALAAPRATAKLLACLPLAGLLLGTAIGARPMSFLFGSPAGVSCLVGAALFDAAGLAWARRIARRAARLAKR
jgi:tight adherence protein B